MICGWSPPSAPRSRSGGAYFAAMADGSGRGLFLLGAVGMDVGWVSWTETETEAEAEAEAAGESAGVSVAEMSLRGIALRALFFCGTGFVFQAAVMPELRDGSPLIVSSPLALSSFVFLFFIAIAVTTFKTSPPPPPPIPNDTYVNNTSRSVVHQKSSQPPPPRMSC